jgi:hypothetical protein
MVFLSNDLVAGFGQLQIANPLTVKRIYQGAGPTYVTFSGATLNGCSNNGGYLAPTWSAANGGVIDNATANRMISILLSSKVTVTQMEVRYKVNDAGTGWNNCAIHGIYLH